ncbi:MAG: WD40 repeat domain-containing protein, partial [candidate division WOR-3 bacterium]
MVWTTDGTEGLIAQLDQLRFRNVSIMGSGVVTLAPSLQKVAALDETAVWQIGEDHSHKPYLATGSRARVFALGKREPVFDGGTGEVLCIATDPQGNLWFGVSPEGKVYRFRPGGAIMPVTELGTTYVFSLLPSSDGGVVSGTGPEGKFFRISPSGNVRLIWTAPQSNITALAWLVPGREVLAGTSPEGLVYRLTFSPSGDVVRRETFFDTGQEEVKGLVAGRTLVFIAANPSVTGSDTAGPMVLAVDRTGVLRWQWRCPDSVAFSLMEHEGRLLVGTGNRGVVYALDTLGSVSVL